MSSSDTKPWEYVKSISETKENIITNAETEEMYNPYMINKSLSYFPDTILYAQDMNLFYNLDKKLQYDYLINTIKPRRRWSGAWPKSIKDDDIELIQQMFNVNSKKALSIKSILTKQQIAELRKQQQELTGYENERNK